MRPKGSHWSERILVGLQTSKPFPLVAFILLMISSFDPIPVKFTVIPVFSLKDFKNPGGQ
jgi:hypothetical protein